MSSIRRINASRANGARSRGPVTPEGKGRSAANAVRHGLLARTLILQIESSDAFQEMLDDFVRRFQPADSIELVVVEEMAAAVWRQRRCWGVETSMVDEAAERASAAGTRGPVAAIAAAYSTLAEGPGLPLVHRYETGANRAFQRALKNLVLLREMNLPNEPNPVSEHQSGDAAEPAPAPPADPAEAPAQSAEAKLPNEPNPISEHQSGDAAEPSPPPPADPAEAPAESAEARLPNEPNPVSGHRPATPESTPRHTPPAGLPTLADILDPRILPLDFLASLGPAFGTGAR